MISTRRLALRQLLTHNPYRFKIPKRMIWTSSSLKMFRRCKRKYFWKYIMRLRQLHDDPALLIGGGFHNCLGEWYRGRRASMKAIALDFYDRISAAAAASNHMLDQKDLDKMEVGLGAFRGMMIGYAANYNTDRDEWKIDRQYIEHKFHVDCGDFDFEGKIDLLKRYKPRSEEREIVEHKTTTKIRSDYITRLPLDTQNRSYVFGTRRGIGVNVSRVLYDVVEKSKLRRKTNETVDDLTRRIALAYRSNPGRHFHREPLEFTDSQIDEFEYQLHQTNKEYQAIVAPLKGKSLKDPGAWQELFNSLPATDANAWTPNDDACDDYFRLCPYMPLCLNGVTKATSRQFEQGEHLHQELADNE